MIEVKICGLRRVADARRALEHGSRFLGCVVLADSPRCASRADVRAIVDVVGPEPVVLVTRRSGVAALPELARSLGVRRVQVHGATGTDLTLLENAGLRCHVVSSLAPRTAAWPAPLHEATAEVPGIVDVGRGGTGRRFDWSLLDDGAPSFHYVAGGITPENVSELARREPFGIDVSSGVERAPGIKDMAKLATLFRRLEEHA